MSIKKKSYIEYENYKNFSIDEKNFLDLFIFAITSNNKEVFMKLHRKRDSNFYIEQSRWFSIYTSSDTSTTFHIKKINFLNNNSDIKLHIKMNVYESFIYEKTLDATYLLKKDSLGIYIKSLDFEELTTPCKSKIRFHSSLKNNAALIAEHLPSFIKFLSTTLKYHQEIPNIVIYLFDSLENISFSIPTHSAYGWYESGEAIKIFVPDFIEDKKTYLLKVLLHELSHLFLVEITNNNLSLYFQEGIAVYLESHFESIVDSSCYAKDALIDQIKLSKSILNNIESDILEFSKLHFLKEPNGIEIYHQGFLWTVYLIKKYTLEKFLIFLKYFKNIDENKKSSSESFILNNDKTLDVFFKHYSSRNLDFVEFNNFIKNLNNLN